MTDFQVEFTCHRWHGGTKMAKLTCYKRRRKKDEYSDCQNCLIGKQIKQEIKTIGETKVTQLTKQFYNPQTSSKPKDYTLKPAAQNPEANLISTQEILQKTGISSGMLNYYQKKGLLPGPVKKEGPGSKHYYDKSILGQIEQLLKTKRPYSKREQKDTNRRERRETQRLKPETAGEDQRGMIEILTAMRADIAWIKQKLEAVYK